MELITQTTINKNQKNMELIELLEENDIRFEIKENRLIVYDHVDLSNTQLKEFPGCPITFCGSLNLYNTPIKEFPNYPMMFCGSLFLNKTKIKELPDRIVCYDLDIRNTSITKIPKKIVANSIFTPVKGSIEMYIEKDGKIEIGRYKKSIEEWEVFFKERKPFYHWRYYPILPPEEYDIVEQDYKTAVKLYESWNS